MKKQVKLISGLMALVLCMGMLGGCANEEGKAEKIIDKAIQELKDVDSFTSNLELVMDVSMGRGNNQISTTMIAQMESDEIIETHTVHGKGYIRMEALGEQEEADLEVYALKEGDELIQYIGVDGDWILNELDSDSLGMIPNEKLWDNLKNEKNVKYAGTGKVDGKNTEAISIEIDGNAMEDTLGEALDSFPVDNEYKSLFTGFDLKGHNLSLKVDFYQDSGLPARITYDLSDLAEGMFESEFFSDLADGIDIDVVEYKMIYTFENYNEVKVINIPDDLEDRVLDDTWENDDEDIEDATDEGVDNPSGPWRSYEFILEGKTYKLPVAYKDFEEAGWEIDSSTARRTKVQADSKEYYVALSNDKGEEVYVTFYNDSNKTKPIYACIVTSIEVEDYELDDFDFSLAGGVTLGMSEDELNAIYKEYSTRNSYYDDEVSYGYKGETNEDYVLISIYDGVIYSLSMEHK